VFLGSDTRTSPKRQQGLPLLALRACVDLSCRGNNANERQR
jgi:hypothetical protein